MAWIELHQSLPTHHRTMALMDALDIDVACAVGHLACLWLWALDNAPDGIITGSARSIARAAHWLGDPQQLVSGLQAAGFLDGDGRLHDWDDYAGRLLERRDREREQTRERVRQWRARQEAAGSIHGSNALLTRYDGVSNAPGNAPVTPSNAPTQPYPTQQNQPFPPSGGAPDADAPDATPAKKRAVSPAPKPNKSGELLDAVKASGDVPIAMTAADHAALKKSPLTAAQVAEVYLALARGEHGTDWQQDNLSVSVAIKAWAGYETAKRGRPAKGGKAPPRNEGPSLPGPISYPTPEERAARDRRFGTRTNGVSPLPVKDDPAQRAAAEQRLVAAGKLKPEELDAVKRRIGLQ